MPEKDYKKRIEINSGTDSQHLPTIQEQGGMSSESILLNEDLHSLSQVFNQVLSQPTEFSVQDTL